MRRFFEEENAEDKPDEMITKEKNIREESFGRDNRRIKERSSSAKGR